MKIDNVLLLCLSIFTSFREVEKMTEDQMPSSLVRILLLKLILHLIDRFLNKEEGKGTDLKQRSSQVRELRAIMAVYLSTIIGE